MLNECLLPQNLHSIHTKIKLSEPFFLEHSVMAKQVAPFYSTLANIVLKFERLKSCL